MSRDDGKVDDNDDREDIRWFENYENRGKIGEHLESLRNKDILNYIKDIERNCRLEVSSGNEDYAGTKRSSNCSVRFSGARGRSSKRVRSRATSRKNKSALSSGRKVRRSSNHRDTMMNSCNRSSRSSRFRKSVDLTNPRNSKENAPARSTLPRRSSRKRGSYNYIRESSSRSYDLYSRTDRRTWPTTTETTSMDITNHSRTVTRGVGNSRITEKKAARPRRFKSLREKQLEEPIYANIYSNISSNEETKLKNFPRFDDDSRKIGRTSRFNAEDPVSGFVANQRLNQFYVDQHAYPTDSLRNSSKNERSEGRYSFGYPRARISARSASWGKQNSRFNRLTTSRLPETSLRWRALRREDEAWPPLEATGSIMDVGPIDRSYRRESWQKNNTDQPRREPDVSGGGRGPSSCRRRPRFLRESGKLCKVVRTREGKLLLGCSCEDTERDDETAECSVQCRCPENVNRDDFRRRATRLKTSSRSVENFQSNDHEEALDFDLPTGEPGRRRLNETHDDPSTINEAAVNFDDDRANTQDDRDVTQSEDLEPHTPFPDDWTYQTRHSASEIARKYERSRNTYDLENNRREAKTVGRKTLRKRVTDGYYLTDEESSFVRKPSRKLAPRDLRGSRYGATESMCDCKELFHDPPAACLVGSCTCIKDTNENNERSDHNDDHDDSPQEISNEEVCCSYCCCCSASSRDNKNDPIRRLESFYEGVNQDTFHEPSRTSTNNKQHRSGTSNEETSRTGTTGRGWLTEDADVRIGKPRYSRDRTNLDRILIYPPRGEIGPPLTLYKGSSNINCRVKGNANTGFRYSVTYVQKFVSPTWMPSASPEVESDAECDCLADHG